MTGLGQAASRSGTTDLDWCAPSVVRPIAAGGTTGTEIGREYRSCTSTAMRFTRPRWRISVAAGLAEAVLRTPGLGTGGDGRAAGSEPRRRRVLFGPEGFPPRSRASSERSGGELEGRLAGAWRYVATCPGRLRPSIEGGNHRPGSPSWRARRSISPRENLTGKRIEGSRRVAGDARHALRDQIAPVLAVG